ncbi:acetyl-CoA carboxylase biotin carboxylase subunit family protein [Pseudomonas sp. R5(2019)]|uniref:ATP-grasp domain-containing protein n=1 Tax=Pseudomonas sp. R5(2019) TaxID=2697566 RepID=UPI0014123B86|nr:ATP-grasp domain-containing protein [Pseudomonas sp. R5(2019)]NBA95040.1 ATP-grasp domain-containing protein [Pseudomonas sp. R5(2019)]
MKPVVLFAPEKILLQHTEDEWLSVLGTHSLIYSDQSAKDCLTTKFPALAPAFRLYTHFNDSLLVELDALAAAKALGTNTIVALAEVDLLRVARIKDRLSGFVTRYEEMTLLYRDKFLMKQKLAEHGIRVNPMSVVRSACEINDFIEQYGYPVVVKPRDGRGSSGVRLLRENTDLLGYLQEQTGTTLHNLMIEKYINAPLLNVNGLYVNGRPVIISPVRSTVTCLDFLDGKSLGFQMLAESNPLYQRCVKLTRDIVEHALPRLGTMLFHLEIFLDGESLIVCEIACRLGGCSVNQELSEAFGINPRLTLIDAERGGPAARVNKLIKPRRLLGQLNIPPRTGKLVEFPAHIDLPFIRYHSVTAKKGAEYSGMTMTNGEIVSAIIEGNSEKAVSDNLDKLDSWVAEQFIWE